MRRRQRRHRLGAGALAIAAALAGCSSGGPGAAAGDGTIMYVPPAKRQAPVTLRGTTLENQPVDVASYRGKVIVLNVWGSWCAPCRKEAPELQAASQRLATQGVQFLGIDNADSDPAQAVAFQKAFGVTYPSLSDPKGDALLALRGAVPPKAIPTTLVLDTQGRIAARITAATTTTTLSDLVQDVIANRDGAGGADGRGSAA